MWLLVFMGSIVLSICIAESSVNARCLSELSMRLLYFGHVCNCCRDGCMYALAAFFLVCVDVMVMSSAFEESCSGLVCLMCIC